MSARFLLALSAASTAAVLAGCSSGSSGGPILQQTPSPRPTPSPTSTLVAAGAHCRQPLGGTIAFEDGKHGLALRITTKKARVVDHALASYAHGPANGHYLIVDVNLKNISINGLQVDPTKFVFTTTNGRKLTVDSGNAPSSGAGHVLDPTYLVSQASEQGPLIYDTPQTHGHIAFVVSGKTACTWTV
jgi:hypothetical protein